MGFILIIGAALGMFAMTSGPEAANDIKVAAKESGMKFEWIKPTGKDIKAPLPWQAGL